MNSPHRHERLERMAVQRKIANLGKTIIGLGGWDAPTILGFCEVENKFVLEKLLEQTGLERVDYQIIHEDSPTEEALTLD